MSAFYRLSSTAPRFLFLGCLTSTIMALGNMAISAAVTVIQDDFNNGSPTTGATVVPGSWQTAGVIAEASGSVTMRTPDNSNQWSTATLSTNTASPSLNIFTNNVSISIRDLNISSFGDQALNGSRFRFGLMPRDNEVYTAPVTNSPARADNNFSQFYNNGNDGLAVNLSFDASGNSTYEVRYKHNILTSATDPTVWVHGSNSFATIASGFVVTGVDFNVNAFNWQLIFYGAGGTSYSRSGTWGTTFNQASWGNATDGFGNAGFVMGVQNMAGAGTNLVQEGYISASIGSITITADTIPEPSRALLLLAGAVGFMMRRRRQVA